MFHKENSTVAASVEVVAVADDHKKNKKKGGGGKGKGGQQQQQPNKKKWVHYKDVPLKKSEKRKLRDAAYRTLFGQQQQPRDEAGAAEASAATTSTATTATGASAVVDDASEPIKIGEREHDDNRATDVEESRPDEAAGGPERQRQPSSTATLVAEQLLNDVFLKGLVVSRTVDFTSNIRQTEVPLDFEKAVLYFRSPSSDSESGERNVCGGDVVDGVVVGTTACWPYRKHSQCVWIQIVAIDRNFIKPRTYDIPSLPLLSWVTGAISSHEGKLLRVPRVLIGSQTSHYLCRGAHLMRAGMTVVAEDDAEEVAHAATADDDEARTALVFVSGNPQPMAAGIYHPPCSNGGGGDANSGRGVTIVTCYGDDFWKQQLPPPRTTTVAVASPNKGGRDVEASTTSPLGGAPYDDGNYGNVGFLEGKRVVPIVAAGTPPSPQQTAEHDDDDDHGDAAVNDGGADANGEGDAVTNEDTSPEMLFHRAVCMSLAQLQPKKQYLPMTVATFYAKHVLQQPGEVPAIKATSYKKLQSYLSEQVESGLIKVGPDSAAAAGSAKSTAKGGKKKQPKPLDPMAMLLDYNRQHTDLAPYLEDATEAAAASEAEQNTRLALLDLYCVPHHFVSLLRIDPDAAKAANASSEERRNTGMLTLQEIRSLLDAYITANELVDPRDLSQIVLDGPLTDALFKKSTSAPPAALSRQDLSSEWKSKMETAYALVEVPGNQVIKLGRGKPPTVDIEVSMRQSRKFVTRLSGFEQFGMSATELSSQISHRFACSATVEDEPTGANKKATSVILIQGNLSDELKALLLGDERLTSHGGAKGSPYRLPKKAVQVVLRKGVPGKNKNQPKKK